MGVLSAAKAEAMKSDIGEVIFEGLREAVDMEKLRCENVALRADLTIAQGNTDAAIEDYNRALAVVEAARVYDKTGGTPPYNFTPVSKALAALDAKVAVGPRFPVG